MSFLLRRLYQVPPLLTGFVRALLPCTPRLSTQTDISSEDLTMSVGGHSVPLREESGLTRDRRLVTIDVLPDDILVEIFYFYVDIVYWPSAAPPNAWHALVHVCHRWRCLAFASPHRLNLRLVYEGHRPISEALDIWPVLPVILISGARPKLLPGGSPHPKSDQRWDNRVAALESEYYNRICEIHISYITDSHWERFAAAMEKPFPELTHLQVAVDFGARVLPDSFLGAGSAPLARLRELDLRRIPFPSMPKLLLSAYGLVTLRLWEIPDSGYISPDAMATALTVMTRLETLNLEFLSPRSRPGPVRRPLPPPTRLVLPALTELVFTGVHEYLEGLLARFDAPLLTYLNIVFFIGIMDLNFDVPQLHRFICHTEEFKSFDHAILWIYGGDTISLTFYPKISAGDDDRRLRLEIRRRELNQNLSSLAQLCSFPIISTLEELEIKESYLPSLHDMENTRWLEFLDPFIALKNLYLTNRVARRVCNALQELSGERATEVLPALCTLFIGGSQSFEHIQEVIRPFVVARQLSGRPVAIAHWEGYW